MTTEVATRPAGGLVTTPAEAAALAPSPEAAMEYARRCAVALATVLEPAGMTTAVGGDRRHVRVEGWQTLAAMTGHTARVAWCREYQHAERGEGWEARAEVLDGLERIVGAGEGMCLRTEKRWRDADEYAIRSMAQTRAISRALASVLRHVVVLAGFEGTPAEELPGEREPAQRGRRQSARGRTSEADARLALKRGRWQELRERGLDDSALAALLTEAGIPNSDALLDEATFARALALVAEASEALARQPGASEDPPTGDTAPDGGAAAPPADPGESAGGADGQTSIDDEPGEDARGPYSGGEHS